MHEKRLKAHKKRYAAYLKKCKKSKKCWAVHIGRMRAHERRMKHRKAHEKRMKHHKKHYHKKRHAAYEKRMKAHKRRYAAYLKKCKKSKKCWAAHKKRLAARRKHIVCMRNKKCRAKWIAAHKKRRAAFLKRCRKSKKCWAVHLRMKAYKMRRAPHEKRAKHYHKKRHAMHEKSLKANKKRRAAHEKRVKQYHNKRRAMHEKRMKQSKKGAFPVVYQHCNFGGYHRTIKRSVNWVHKLKIKNDDLSSIKVPAGKCVRLYEHINYKRRSWTICGKKSITCFVNHTMKPGKSWNDQVSSIAVFNKPQMRRRL